MFGRVYAAAVMLPKTQFDFGLMKDSKKFTSKTKLEEAEAYIKDHAIAYAVDYEDERSIERNNILRATQMAMHSAVHRTLRIADTLRQENTQNALLIIDGNIFTPFIYEPTIAKNTYSECRLLHGAQHPPLRHEMVKGGDNIYASVAAASILAKTARDRYVRELCDEYPELSTRYGLDHNMGYGTKQHLDGIHKFGITAWHRRTFGACKEYC
jgi:ribonuclease HII